jgi:hypothetical protein
MLLRLAILAHVAPPACAALFSSYDAEVTSINAESSDLADDDLTCRGFEEGIVGLKS